MTKRQSEEHGGRVNPQWLDLALGHLDDSGEST